MITNSANTIANMTQETVEKIFTGEYMSWSQVPGHAITTPIDLYDRDGAAREQNGFETIFLEEALKVAPSATAETTDELEREAVAADPNAIGFVPFSFTSGVNAVPYQGVACTRENGASGSYGGVRNLWLLSKGPVEGPAAAFVELDANKRRSGEHHRSQLPAAVRRAECWPEGCRASCRRLNLSPGHATTARAATSATREHAAAPTQTRPPGPLE